MVRSFLVYCMFYVGRYDIIPKLNITRQSLESSLLISPIGEYVLMPRPFLLVSC